MNEPNEFVDWYVRFMSEWVRLQSRDCLSTQGPKSQLRSTFARLMAQPTEAEQKEKDAAIGFLVHDTFRVDR